MTLQSWCCWLGLQSSEALARAKRLLPRQLTQMPGKLALVGGEMMRFFPI